MKNCGNASWGQKYFRSHFTSTTRYVIVIVIAAVVLYPKYKIDAIWVHIHDKHIKRRVHTRVLKHRIREQMPFPFLVFFFPFTHIISVTTLYTQKYILISFDGGSKWETHMIRRHVRTFIFMSCALILLYFWVNQDIFFFFVYNNKKKEEELEEK